MPKYQRPPAYPELAAELARRGLHQRSLAAKVGCTPETVSQVVRGQLVPSPGLRRRIAVALGRTETDLFGGAS